MHKTLRRKRLSEHRLVRAASRVLLGCAFAISATSARPSGFDREAWRNDYAFLKQEMERSYANLAWFASPSSGVNVPALERRTRRALEQAESDEDAKVALLAFVGGFHDGHFSAVTVLEPAISEAKEPATPALDKLDAVAGCAALGYASTRSIPFSLPFETLDGFALESDGVSRAFRAGVVMTTNGTRLGLVRIAYFRQRDYPARCVQDWTALQQTGQAIDAAALRKKLDGEWFEILAEQLRRFQREHVAAVLVDVGDNGGGNDAGDWAARLFTDKPVRSARLWMAAADDAAGYFDESMGDLRKALQEHSAASPEAREALTRSLADFERRKADIPARHCDLSWAWREQRNWNPSGCSRLIDAGFASGARDYLPAGALGDKELASALYWPATVDAQRGAWSGPVYVLTNAKTYSAAEMFSAVMRDNGIARTVGVATGGDGCGFMQEQKPVVLPHSRLRFRIPDCVRLRADGTDEVAGIRPDLPLLPTEGESDRARAARALAVIEADLRKAGTEPPPR